MAAEAQSLSRAVRLHAVRYNLAVDGYLKEKGYPFKSLVAFSGTLEDGGVDFTETGMNTASAGKSIPETTTAETFKQTNTDF